MTVFAFEIQNSLFSFIRSIRLKYPNQFTTRMFWSQCQLQTKILENSDRFCTLFQATELTYLLSMVLSNSFNWKLLLN